MKLLSLIIATSLLPFALHANDDSAMISGNGSPHQETSATPKTVAHGTQDKAYTHCLMLAQVEYESLKNMGKRCKAAHGNSTSTESSTASSKK
jgi:hypothetical protein